MFKIKSLQTGLTFKISKNIFDRLKKEKRNKFKRRSRLYVPLTNDRFIYKTQLIESDGFIFDLEDSIPTEYKAIARNNINNLPSKRDGVEYILRINDCETDFWKDDIDALNLYPFDTVMIPKVESAKQLDIILNRLKLFDIRKIVLIETITGLKNAQGIVGRLSYGDAIGYGAGDLSTSLGICRAPIYDSCFLQHVLIQILLAAKNSKIDVFDPPFRDYNDIDSLQKEAEFCRKYNTTGKQAIHPSQIDIINRVYSPSDHEISSYIAESLKFEGNPEKQAISLNNKYIGKPTKTMAMKKLIEFYSKGFIDIDHVKTGGMICKELLQS